MVAFIIFSLLKGDYPPAIGFGLFLVMLALFLHPSRVEVDDQEIRLRSGLFISRRAKTSEVVRVREELMTGALSLGKERGLRIETSKLTISACVEQITELRQTLLKVIPDLHEYGDELRRH